ncbi:MAG: corrinoid protein-associated methyltransferase CpaM [Candidatus Heimdallarchaeaceae archaeon]
MSLIYMKFLESYAKRYDRGITLLTLGQIKKVYATILSYIQSGMKVLDVGCGTGSIPIEAAKKGAKVVGIDINPSMLEIAQKKAKAAGVENQIDFVEKGIAELDTEPTETYDLVISSFCFSELNMEEQKYAVENIIRILVKGGYFILADEIYPKKIYKRIFYWLIRFPLLVITFILTQQTTSPLKNIEQLLAEKKLYPKSIYENWLGSIKILIWKKVVN